MLSALEKWLLTKAGDVGSLSRMSVPQMMGKAARKTGEGVRDSYRAIKESPKLAAGAAGAGAAGGLALGGPEEETFEAELEELRRKYGV